MFYRVFTRVVFQSGVTRVCIGVTEVLKMWYKRLAEMIQSYYRGVTVCKVRRIEPKYAQMQEKSLAIFKNMQKKICYNHLIHQYYTHLISL